MIKRHPLALLLTLLLTSQVWAQSEAERQAEAMSAQAQQALLLQRYPEAAAHFAEEETLLRANKLPGIDATLYWQAFVALKQRRHEAVQRHVTRLLKEFPDSDWADDARALLPYPSGLLGLKALTMLPTRAELQHRDRTMSADEAKVDALLLQTPSTATSDLLALIRHVDSSEQVVRRALYALNLIAPAEAIAAARQLIEQTSSSDAVQRDALILLASSPDTAIQATLVSRSPTLSAELRSHLMNAWATAGHLQAVRTVLADETDASVRWQGINALAVLADEPSLLALAKSPVQDADRLAAINGLAYMERGDALIALLDDPALRASKLTILRALGTAGGAATPARLVHEFADTDRNQRQAVADALAQLDAGESLLSLLRNETDTRSRVLLMTAIQRLNDPAILAQAEVLLEQPSR